MIVVVVIVVVVVVTIVVVVVVFVDVVFVVVVFVVVVVIIFLSLSLYIYMYALFARIHKVSECIEACFCAAIRCHINGTASALTTVLETICGKEAHGVLRPQ